LSEIVGGGFTDLFAPSIVFGEVEDEFGRGDAGALFFVIAE